jgi:hypothetical protein
MLDLSASGTKSAILFKTLLVTTAANVSGAINHWDADGRWNAAGSKPDV